MIRQLDLHLVSRYHDPRQFCCLFRRHNTSSSSPLQLALSSNNFLFCPYLNYGRFLLIAQLSIAHPARSWSTNDQTVSPCRDVSDRSTDSSQVPPDQTVLILLDPLSDALEVHVYLILSCHYPRDNRKQTLLSLATAKKRAWSSGVTYVFEKSLLLSGCGADQIHN